MHGSGMRNGSHSITSPHLKHNLKKKTYINIIPYEMKHLPKYNTTTSCFRVDTPGNNNNKKTPRMKTLFVVF